MFIAFDGIDGAGKTSQLDRTYAWLTGNGRAVERVRDPGSTSGGEAIRGLLLHSDLMLHRRTEALLYMAARSQLVEERIRPALVAGKTVLSDRFLLSNVAYQSAGEAVPAEVLWKLGTIATEGLLPDLTVLLDLPAEVAFRRLNRATDRMESRGEAYMERVRQVFLKEVARAGRHHVVVDATLDPERVWEQIERALSLYCGKG